MTYDEAIRLDPKNAASWNNKGASLNGQSKYDEAIQALDEAIRLDPKLAASWNNKGASLNGQGKYDEAIQALDEAIRLDPNDANARLNKGLALVFQGKLEDASKSWEEALKLNPEFPEVWYQKGLAFEGRGISDAAITCYDKAIEMDPNYVEAWNSKISALKKVGRYDEADATYYEYKYYHKGWSIINNIAWLSCGFGILWQNTIYVGLFFLILFTIIYLIISRFGDWNKTELLHTLNQSFWFSLIVLLSAPKELYPLETKFYDNYSEHIKYWPVIERIIGWGLLILLINTLSRVMIRY